MPSQSTRPFDLVVFGATSFVGEILCQYLVDRHGTDGDLNWAIAGRSESKLAAVAAKTGATVELVETDGDGGFFTPPTAFGDSLIDRLETHAGLTFAVLEA